MQIPPNSRRERVLSQPLEIIGRPNGLRHGTRAAIAEILKHRELINRLVAREIRSRYKGSSLGVLWSLFRPLAQLLIYYVAVGKFLGAARSIPDFAIFVFTGLTVWGLFNEVVLSGTSSIVGNSGLIKKVYLPREIFPLAAVGGALFNFAVQLVILIAATALLGRAPLHVELLFAPASLILILIYGTAFALLLSAINVYLRDVQHVVEIILIVVFWASPVVYSFANVDRVLHGSWLLDAYLANPVTLAIMGMQKALWLSGSGSAASYWPPDLWLRMLIASGVGVVFVWVAQRVFTRLQGNFAQEL